MNTITALAIWKNSLLLALFILVEVLGVGPIARYRAGDCFDIIERTGVPLFVLVLYSFFFLVWPLIDLLAIILKPRVTINNFGVGN